MKKSIAGLCLLSLAYFLIWLWLSFPYRYAATDDLNYVRLLSDNTFWGAIRHNESFVSVVRLPRPVFNFSLLVFKAIWSTFSDHLPSTLLFHTIFMNSISVFLIGFIVFRLTENIVSALGSSCLYGTSAWPITYTFWFSYTTFAATLALCVLFFMLEAHLQPNRRTGFIVLSGVFSGLYFWSSTSAAVMSFLFLVMICCLFPAFVRKQHWKIILTYCFSLYCSAAPFIVTSLSKLAGQIFHNIKTTHYSDALSKFQYIPKSPLFSFFYILTEYNPVLSISFLVIFGFFAVNIIKKLYRKSWKKNFSAREKHLFLLTMIFWLHLIIIDILPTTKLGRTHFVIYPLFIIIITCVFHRVIHNYLQRFRASVVLCSSVLILLIVFINISYCSEIIRVRTYTPKYLASTAQQTQELFVLEEDPHALPLERWLSHLKIKRIRMSELQHLLLTKKKKNFRVLVGPHGVDSGISIMGHCTLNNFILEEHPGHELLKTSKVIGSLPYYMYFPFFLFEEEICQALYFLGKVPDYNAESKRLSLLIW